MKNIALSIITLATSLTGIETISAQTTKNNKNPFTLVYDGAITENIRGKVNIHQVSYKINDITIAANVYTPPHYNPANKYAAIVVAHPNGGVKEQVAGLYAQKLAEQGYITIAADAAYQGASSGFPRNVDKPANRIEDIHAMADFIAQYKGVDLSKLGLLGICGGGGYALKAAQSDKRFKAVATLSMFNSGVVRRNGFQNAQLSTIQERLKQASAVRMQEAAGGEILYAGTANPTDKEIAAITTDLYREGYEYYYRNYSHPNSTFKYTMSSLLDLMTWDASTNMDLIEQPLLMIAGSKADTKYMTDDAFLKAANTKFKELFLLDGASHIETYWKPGYVIQAVDKLVNFYSQQLTDNTVSAQAQKKYSIEADTVFAKGEKITNTNFTGTAYLKMLIAHDKENPTAVGNVTFEPGARTKWHLHPAGQILLVTDGVGYYQEKGQPKKILRKGDVVKCPPNTEHWHGASADTYFVQLAVTNNDKGATVWLQAVSNEEYNK